MDKQSLNDREDIHEILIKPDKYSLKNEDSLDSRRGINTNVDRKLELIDIAQCESTQCTCNKQPVDRRGKFVKCNHCRNINNTCSENTCRCQYYWNNKKPTSYRKSAGLFKFILRWIWYILSLDGTVTAIYRKFMGSIFGSLFFVASGMILSAKDLTDESYDLWGGFFYHLFVVLSLIAAVASLVESLILIEYFAVRHLYSTRRRMRRLRFAIIENQVLDNNPYASSYTWHYDSENDDPDVAYYHFSTSKHTRMFWFLSQSHEQHNGIY
jgi:hypothetical protein